MFFNFLSNVAIFLLTSLSLDKVLIIIVYLAIYTAFLYGIVIYVMRIDEDGEDRYKIRSKRAAQFKCFEIHFDIWVLVHFYLLTEGRHNDQGFILITSIYCVDILLNFILVIFNARNAQWIICDDQSASCRHIMNGLKFIGFIIVAPFSLIFFIFKQMF